MRTLNWSALTGLLFLLPALTVAQEPPQKLVQGTAERDITVFFDPDSPFDWEDVNAIIESRQFAASAIEELTGKKAPELIPVNTGGGFQGFYGWRTSPDNLYVASVRVRRDLIRGSAGSLPLRLQVEVTQREDDDNKVKAEKYAELVVKDLDKVLNDLSRRSFEKRLAQLRSAADEERRKVHMAEQKVEELSQLLRRKTVALPEAVLHELVSDLTKQQQALEVELVGMKGRSEALQGEVVKLSDRLQSTSTENEVVRNLERVLEIREKALQAVKQLHDQGAGASYLDRAKAEEQVALARVELAQAKQATARPTDALLEKLNDELSQIAVGIAENEAKLKFLSTRLDEYGEILEDAAQTKALRQQLDSEISQLITLKQEADAAQASVAELESSFRPARVEVFQLKTSEEKPADGKNGDGKADKSAKR